MSGNNEYSFWWLVKQDKVPFSKLSGEQQQAYLLLENKVAMYGSNSLNRNGWGWTPSVPKPYGGINEGNSASEPIIVKSLNEASKDYNFDVKDFKPLSGQPNLYMTKNKLGTNTYYFVAPKMVSPEKQSSAPINNKPPSTSLPMPKKTTTTYTGVKKTKDLTTPKPKLRSEYDLLFNSLDYQTSYDAEIKEMAMDLIFAGDDLLDNFNYESIDYLPDYDIDVQTKQGYFNAYSEYKKQSAGVEIEKIESDEETQNVISGSGDDIQLANELISELEAKIGSSVKTLDLLKIFGSFDASDKQFKVGLSNGMTVDFYYPLDSKYDNLAVEIHFDLI